MGGGRKRRASAWPLCAGFVAAHGIFQIITMGPSSCFALIFEMVLMSGLETALITHLYRTNHRFYAGTTVGPALYMATAAWILDVLLALALVGTGLAGHWDIPERKGYEVIPDERPVSPHGSERSQFTDDFAQTSRR